MMNRSLNDNRRDSHCLVHMGSEGFMYVLQSIQVFADYFAACMYDSS